MKTRHTVWIAVAAVVGGLGRPAAAQEAAPATAARIQEIVRAAAQELATGQAAPQQTPAGRASVAR